MPTILDKNKKKKSRKIKPGEEAKSVKNVRRYNYEHANPIDEKTGKPKRGRPRKAYIEGNVTKLNTDEEKKNDEDKKLADIEHSQKYRLNVAIGKAKHALERNSKKNNISECEENLSDLFILMSNVEDEKERLELNRWIRLQCRNFPTPKAFNIWHKTYIYGARYNFDDYLIAVEWNRVENAKFWTPRRRVLEGKHSIATKIDNFINDPNARYLGISMPPGVGKALANDTPVLTRKGWKNHGDLVIGDEVIGLDGKFKKVIHVMPKCQLDCLITFSNGERIQCHERHEWLVYDRARGKEVLQETRCYEKRTLVSYQNNGKKRYTLQVPKKSYVVGEHKELYVDPYTLGVWLGDGTNLNPTICGAKNDISIIDRIVRNGNEISWTTEHKDTHVMYYGIKGLRQKLQKYGMCYSRKRTDKRIPEDYLTASIDQRLNLLAGLLDTDGCRIGNKYSFSTSEYLLRDDFIKLVSTFGWRCCVIANEPHLSSSGIKSNKPCYRIEFTPDCYIPCELERKRLISISKQRKLAIVSIERVEPKEGNCISVEGGMYLVGNTMIPTHNTTLIKFLMAYICGRFPESANMYVSYSDALVKMVYDNVQAILTDVNEYDQNTIFPKNGQPECSAEFKTISYRKKGDFPTIGMISLGGSVTGRTRANKFLITDDLVKNKEMARSPERLNNLYEDYKSTLTTRMIGDDVKQIQLGTIWSSHDPISRMKLEHQDDPRYTFIAIPVWDENKHSNFNYNHPDRYTDEKIAEIQKSLDPVDFSCLYMQQGIDKEGLAFTDLKYYNGVLPDGEPDNILFATDIAWGGGDSLSMPICYVYGEDCYIHDVIFDNRDKLATKPRVLGKILQHKCKMGRMEANNGGDEYCDDINRMLKEQNYSMNLTHKKAPTRISKLTRIEQHAPIIRNFYYRSVGCRDSEYDKFMNELQTFSFTSKNLHDDAADSMAMLVDFMTVGVKSVKAIQRLF